MPAKNKTRKILGYLVVTFVIIQGAIIFYQLVSKERKSPRDTYTTEDIAKFYNECVYGGKTVQYYPEIARANCQCLTDSTTNKFTKAEWKEIDTLPPERKFERLKDIIIYCAHKSGRDTVHILTK